MPSAARRRRARADALVQFQPEEDVLTAAIRQAYQNRHAAVRSAHGQAEGVLNAVAETVPAARKIYRQQAKSQRFAADTYGDDIAELGPIADSIRAGAALERQTAHDQLAQARSSTLTGLTQQRVAARSGEQFAVAKARTDFIGAIKDILTQKQSLAQRKGAFTASEIARLAEEAAAHRLSLRTLAETERSHRAGERETARSHRANEDNAANDGGGSKPKLTPGQRNDALDNITAARGQYDAHSGAGGFDPKTLRGALQVGKVIGADGKPISIPRVTSNLEITAGFQLARFGYINPNVLRELRRRGYRIPKAWHRKKHGKTDLHAGGINVQVPNDFLQG